MTIPFNNTGGSASGAIPSPPAETTEWRYRTDDEAIRIALDRFKTWDETGAEVFDTDDYAILFQAGTFEYHAMAETLARVVYEKGPIPLGPSRTQEEE